MELWSKLWSVRCPSRQVRSLRGVPLRLLPRDAMLMPYRGKSTNQHAWADLLICISVPGAHWPLDDEGEDEVEVTVGRLEGRTGLDRNWIGTGLDWTVTVVLRGFAAGVVGREQEQDEWPCSCHAGLTDRVGRRRRTDRRRARPDGQAQLK